MAEHEYESDPQSGAGNCTCGASHEHRRHPHRFRRAHGPASHCVCGLNPVAPIHNRKSKPATQDAGNSNGAGS